MSIRWDAPLARHLAATLDARLGGARLRAIRLDGAERDLSLLFREHTLVWRLHPTRGFVLLREPTRPLASDLRWSGKVRRVHAPPDERLIRIELLPRGGSGSRDVVVELMGNQWNAVVTERPSGVVRHVLWARDSGRGHRVGARYVPPPPTGRLARDGDLSIESWLDLLGDAEAGERPRLLVRSVAWTSPLNAGALLGDDLGGRPDRERLAEGHARWARLAIMETAVDPVVLDTPRGPQPYGTPLPGTASRAVADLLAAFDEAASERADTEVPAVPLLDPELERRLQDALERAQSRWDRLCHELEALDRADPVDLRARGDLLLARYGEVPTGADHVTLTGFDGTPVALRLDPSRAPHENAARLYQEAARVERARERLPPLVDDAGRSLEALGELARRARAGEARPEELEAALPARSRPRAGGIPGPALPYRSFRSSGDLEIRVGRGARHNDALTFRHASPDDIWMHARHAAGAHVILRWPGPGNPPARDLEEAAVLAALHSRARTSGSVPVDWTLRKYVRKPRKAPAGAVVPERVRTLFVRPDPDVEAALAAPGPAPRGEG